ncbi:hypothetical protein, partial [Cyclobacterium sediminis]
PEKSFKQLNSGFLCYVFVNYYAGYQVINKSARSPSLRMDPIKLCNVSKINFDEINNAILASIRAGLICDLQ